MFLSYGEGSRNFLAKGEGRREVFESNYEVWTKAEIGGVGGESPMK